MKKRSAFICVALLVSAALATDWYVSPDGTGGGTSPTDRGEAITTMLKMASGDTLYFAPGTYNLDKNKSQAANYGYGAYFRTLDNTFNLKFIGESDNPEDVRLVGTPADGMRIFFFKEGGHVLRNLLCSGGYTSYQGAGLCMSDAYVVKHEQSFTASNCIVENCSAAYLGSNRGGVWRDCVIRNNEVRNTTATPNNGPGAEQVEGSGGGVFHATLYDCVHKSIQLPDWLESCPIRGRGCRVGPLGLWDRREDIVCRACVLSTHQLHGYQQYGVSHGWWRPSLPGVQFRNPL